MSVTKTKEILSIQMRSTLGPATLVGDSEKRASHASVGLKGSPARSETEGSTAFCFVS